MRPTNQCQKNPKTTTHKLSHQWLQLYSINLSSLISQLYPPIPGNIYHSHHEKSRHSYYNMMSIVSKFVFFWTRRHILLCNIHVAVPTHKSSKSKGHGIRSMITDKDIETSSKFVLSNEAAVVRVRVVNCPYSIEYIRSQTVVFMSISVLHQMCTFFVWLIIIFDK